MAEEFRQIAKVLKSNGTSGELVVSFPEYDPSELQENEPVFIKYDELPVPFFIEYITPRGASRAVVKLSGIDTYEDAEEVVGRAVYVDVSGSEDEEGEEESLDALVGWVLLNEEGHVLGIIDDFEDIPGNPCLYVDTETGRSMIPFHEDLVLEINEEGREIVMAIPDGLL